MTNLRTLGHLPLRAARAAALAAVGPAAVALTAVLLGAVACGPEVNDPEAAPAFPNRRPQFEAQGHSLGYVSNYSSDTVSVIDLERMELLGEAPVGRDPVDLDGPSALAIDPRAGVAYTVFSYPQSVVGAHELAAGTQGRNGYVQTLDLRDLAPLGEKRIELEPLNVAFEPKLELVAVTHSDSAKALAINDPIEVRRASVGLLSAEGLRLQAQEPTGDVFLPTCVLPGSVAFGVKSERVYVVCTGENVLATLDAKNRSLIGLGPTSNASAGKPGALVIGEPGLLLSNELARSVALLSEADTPEVIAEVAVAGVPRFGLFTSDTQALVPTQGPDALLRIDFETQSIVQEVALGVDECEGPSSLNRGAQGELWLVCEADRYHPGRLVSLDPDSLAIVSHVPLGLYPTRMGVWEP